MQAKNETKMSPKMYWKRSQQEIRMYGTLSAGQQWGSSTRARLWVKDCSQSFSILFFFVFILQGWVNQQLQKLQGHMEENIPYRRLKSLKPLSIKSTSQKLLRPIFRNRSAQKSQKLKNSIMSQNVTQYQYMLSDPHLKENYINWATNLRGYGRVQVKEISVCDPPSVFYKPTEIEDIRKKGKGLAHSSHVNTAEFLQYFGKDAVNIPENELTFLNDLRKITIKDKQNAHPMVVHEKIFKNYGGKQRGTLPKILKKSAIKKLRDINLSDYETELDGTHKYPEYTYKNLREKNSALITSLCQNHEQISLPGLAWSIGLRSY